MKKQILYDESTTYSVHDQGCGFFPWGGEVFKCRNTVKRINYSGISDIEHFTQGQKWKFASIAIKLAIQNIPAFVKCT